MRKHLLAVGILIVAASVFLYASDYSFDIVHWNSLVSNTANPATTAAGTISLAKSDSVSWRNFANNGNLSIAPFVSTVGNNSLSLGDFDSVTANVFSLVNIGAASYLSETRRVSTGLTTTAGLLVTTQTTGNVGTSALAATDVAGIATSSRTSAQLVEIAVKGIALCVADNSITIGDLVGVGTTTAGTCKDLGSTTGTTVSSLLLIVGKALTTTSVGSSFLVQIYGQGVYGAGNPATGQVTSTICSGSVALGTGAISSGAAATTVTATCTGLLTTDNIAVDFNGSPLAMTGYIPSASGMLTIVKWPTANTLNLAVVNNTGASITPGAITVNFHAYR